MEDPTLHYLFGPLSRKYCIWFYWLSVIGFVYLMIILIGAIIALVSSKRAMNSVYAFQLLGALSVYAIFYFQNRLLYTMCAGNV